MSWVLRLLFGLAALLMTLWAREVRATLRDEARMEGMIGRQGRHESDTVSIAFVHHHPVQPTYAELAMRTAQELRRTR